MITVTVVLVTKDLTSVYSLVLDSIEMACHTQESVLSHFQTPRLSPKIPRCASYFQLSFKALFAQPKIPV